MVRVKWRPRWLSKPRNLGSARFRSQLSRGLIRHLRWGALSNVRLAIGAHENSVLVETLDPASHRHADARRALRRGGIERFSRVGRSYRT